MIFLPGVERAPQPTVEWVPMQTTSGGAGLTGLTTSLITGWTLRDAQTDAVASTCAIPEWAIAGVPIQVKVWIGSTTGGANIVLSGHTQVRADGAASNAAPSNITAMNASTFAITANSIKELPFTTVNNAVPGDLFHFRWYREGGHANDSLAASVAAVGTWAGFQVLR